jgi:predicted permease
MLAIVLTTVLAVAAGVVLERRDNSAARRVRATIVRMVLWVLGPFIAYVNLAHLHASTDVAVGILVALASIAVAGVTMALLARRRLRLDRASSGAAMVCTIQANTGYFGLPLCAALFNRAAFSQAVAYDALVSMPAFLLGSFTVGAVFGSAGRDRQLRRHIPATLFGNPMIPVVVVALLVPSAWAPEALVQPAKLAALALAPLGFLMVGITLSDEAEEGALRIPPPLTQPVAAVIALRMLLTPALVIGVAALLIDLPPAYPLLAAAPVGLNTIVVAHQTGLDLRLTVDAIAWTTAIALLAVVATAIATA